ncbi:MAG: family 10 glycosylhydrolase, partial [Segetibacter sp.]
MKKNFFIKLLLISNALTIFSTIYSQVIKRSNVPAPAFEVTGSIYPWEVHDEGIDLILDNMTSIAGINSVYMLAVMHQEHRPFNSDKLPGTFMFNHNPVRREWDAEDAKAYFRPHLEMYGRIKPELSSYEWLNQTDWLKIVLDKAHARGLRAGAEVSHTFIPIEYLNKHPEIQQRDINGKLFEGNMNARPCPNNPDVRAYLLALYGDIASNYDVDYIQTCMLLYSNSDEPTKGGTCFCTYCQKEAKAMGFDMEAAIPILRDNPNAQPQLDQWLDFRRASTTKIYKLVTDRIHQANPKIDFRLNDLNNRSSGLHLDELKDGNINSVHLSTH